MYNRYMSAEQITPPERLNQVYAEALYSHQAAREFIAANGLMKRLHIGTKIHQIVMLNDNMAIRMAAGRRIDIRERITKLESGRLSKRRILGVLSRRRIRQLEESQLLVSDTYEYLMGELKPHEEEYCLTDQQKKDAAIIFDATLSLNERARGNGINISRRGTKLGEDILGPWENEYREKLYAVT